MQDMDDRDVHISMKKEEGQLKAASSIGLDGESGALPIHTTSQKADSQHAASGEVVRKRSTWRLTAILTALFLCLFLAALDTTIIATVVPVITHDLASPSGYTWIGAAYLLATAASGPIWAKLSDIWGRKLIVLLALAIFFVASVACATAQTMRTLIAARALEGVAGGGLILLVHICISDLFSLRRRSLFLGVTEFIWAVAAGIGPLLGGVFASFVSWRWCFYINLPIAGIAFILVLLSLDISHQQTSFRNGLKAIDWIGTATFLAFTLMILLGLDFGGSIFPWSSAKVIALIVVGSLMIVAFVYSETSMAKYPLIPMNLFKSQSNVAALLVTFFHGLVSMGAMYYMPLYFQSVLGKSPFDSGVLLLPLLVTVCVAGMFTGYFMHRTGRYYDLCWIGTVLLCIGTGLFIYFGVDTSLATLIGFQIVCAVGIGFLYEPPLIAVQAHVAQADVTTAISTVTFVRDISVTISLVIGGAVFQNSMDSRAPFLRQAGLSESLIDDLSGRNAEANVMLANTLFEHPGQQLAVREAFALSIRNMWILYTVLAFGGVLAAFFIKQVHLSTEHTETVTGIRSENEIIEANGAELTTIRGE